VYQPRGINALEVHSVRRLQAFFLQVVLLLPVLFPETDPLVLGVQDAVEAAEDLNGPLNAGCLPPGYRLKLRQHGIEALREVRKRVIGVQGRR
jgi:hypothetical protein